MPAEEDNGEPEDADRVKQRLDEFRKERGDR